ncbi:MAG: hypothetical protein NVS9B2_14750 [Steroidobacteraceae bacterium]
MNHSRGTPCSIEATDVRIGTQGFLAASLRYFEPSGSLAAFVRDVTGQSLPAAQGATFDAANSLMLAWRSPTETLLLCNDSMVEQTGGVCVYRVQGPRSGDLLQRMGAVSAVPGVGEARVGRLAELQVLTACVQAGEFLLVVERVYADHLVQWICTTVADFDA